MASMNTQSDLLAATLAAALAPAKPQLSTAPAEKPTVSRATWKGVLSFGTMPNGAPAISMSVKTYKATEQEEVKLNMIHACNHAQIEAADKAGKPSPEPVYNQLKRADMRCPVCEEAVESESIKKGYQYAEGKFVVITDEERKMCKVANVDSMPIDMFIDVNDIDPVYFAVSEYLVPDKGFEIPFGILRKAMVDTNTVGIAKTSQHGREETVAIRPYGEDGMIISYLYFDNEVRACDKWTHVDLDGKEQAALVDIATQLVVSMTDTFDITKAQDLSMRQFVGLINDKIMGRTFTAPALSPTPVVDKKMDLMSRLSDALKVGKKKSKSTAA